MADNTKSVAVGDIDHDGDLDVIVGNDKDVRVYVNDRLGRFIVGPVLGSVSDNTTKVFLGDTNGDGYLDIAVGQDGGQNTVYINDKTGDFAETINLGPGRKAL